MIFIILEIVGGLLLLAFGSAVFWYIGQERAFTPRQRASTLIANLVVTAVLSAWAGGASLIAHSIILMFAPS